MEIRPLNENDDRYAISRIYEESWKYAYKGIIPFSYLEEISRGRWVKILESPGFYSLIMFDGDKPIGTLCYCHSRYEDMANYGEIVSIYFLPEYTGKGFGGLLMDAGIKALAKAGYKDVYLWALEKNVIAKDFYEKYGFYKSGEVLYINIGGKDLKEIQYIYNIKKSPL